MSNRRKLIGRVQAVIANTLVLIFALAGIAFFLAALAVPAWQIYRWLLLGEWQSISVIDGTQAVRVWMANANPPLTDFDNWLAMPTRWLGLHKLLSFLHASVALFAASVFAAYAAHDFTDPASAAPRTRRPRRPERETTPEL